MHRLTGLSLRDSDSVFLGRGLGIHDFNMYSHALLEQQIWSGKCGKQWTSHISFIQKLWFLFPLLILVEVHTYFRKLKNNRKLCRKKVPWFCLCVCVCVCVYFLPDSFFFFLACLVSCVWLFATPMDCGLPDSSLHGIFQARILEWVAVSFSRGSSPLREQNSHFLCPLLWQVDSLLLSHLGSLQ